MQLKSDLTWKLSARKTTEINQIGKAEFSVIKFTPYKPRFKLYRYQYRFSVYFNIIQPFSRIVLECSFTECAGDLEF